MGKISIQELANVLIEKNEMSKRDANSFVNEMFDIIQQHLETDKLVKVKGLGTFKIIDVEDRESVNVNTGERVLIGGHAKITYTPDVVLKELVNRPFSQFETIVLNDGVDFDDLFSGVVDDPEVEPEPVSDDDHSSMPLVDFGLEDDNPVDAHTPDVEPIVELDNETEDEFEEDFDDDINDETEPEAELEPEQIVEPKPEPMIEPKGTKVIEEITDEEIPGWVIESFAAPKSEESTPINQSADEEIAAVFDEVKEEIVPSVAEEEVLTPVIEIPEKDVSEEESEPENDPESEQEPAEPIAEPEPESEPEENVDESESEEDDDEPEFDTKPTRERKSGGMWLVALLALIVGVGGGYFLGSYYPYETLMAPAEGGTVINVQKADVEKVAAPEPKVEESVAEEPAAETAEPNEADAKAKAEEDVKAKSAADTKATSSDKYDAMDLRVRLGAYRIVGTDKVLKVKEGDDLVKISRRTLGPDMECYLEVYNNIKASTPLKVGQEIKIPKLELKKKKKAATAN